ncbi:hypothetical protein ACJZ2D_007535 [Fusarium nematophilum]
MITMNRLEASRIRETPSGSGRLGGGQNGERWQDLRPEMQAITAHVRRRNVPDNRSEPTQVSAQDHRPCTTSGESEHASRDPDREHLCDGSGTGESASSEDAAMGIGSSGETGLN